MDAYIYDGKQMKGRAEVEMGPGPHRIRWLMPAGHPFGYFTLDRVAWVQVEMFVPPGASLLDLVPAGGGVVWSEETTVWIDRFALIDIRRPLAEVLPGQGFHWSTNPENPWVGGSEEALAGRASSASPSWLETTVAGPALVDWTISGWVDFSVDGKKAVLPSYADFSNQRSGGVFLEPGLHTLRWTNPGDSVVRLRDVTLSPMSGVPEVSLRGDKVSLLCPRPVGVMDFQLKPQLAFGDGAYYTQLDGAYTIAESTPERIGFEMPVPPGAREMLIRLIFQR